MYAELNRVFLYQAVISEKTWKIRIGPWLLPTQLCLPFPHSDIDKRIHRTREVTGPYHCSPDLVNAAITPVYFVRLFIESDQSYCLVSSFSLPLDVLLLSSYRLLSDNWLLDSQLLPYITCSPILVFSI